MTKAKHTPGPWEYDEYSIEGHRFGDTNRYVRSNAHRHWAICRVDATSGGSDPSLDISEDEALANARLIAAAPDMLEALKAMLDWFEQDNPNPAHDEIMSARAAIAKATGEQ